MPVSEDKIVLLANLVKRVCDATACNYRQFSPRTYQRLSRMECEAIREVLRELSGAEPTNEDIDSVLP